MGDTRLNKLPPVERVALFYPDGLNKGCTNVLQFPFAALYKAQGFPEPTMSHLPIEQPAIEGRNNAGLIITQKGVGYD